MCQLCEETRLDVSGFAVLDRPAETLVGLEWEGSHGEAAAGSVRATLTALQARLGKGDLWSGPIIGLSFNDGPERFRYFAGVAAEEAVPVGGLVGLQLPPRRYVASWHGQADGDVVAHYGRMIAWLTTKGMARSLEPPHHREEYPRDGVFDGPPVLRLLLPLR
ncbi:hypothetical protein EJC49_11540 [Aquibium carbonis]|uniref:GyrI-like small molecule binding domain-containing protein n=1 Tax=Aquibium carbonis TaxID=2495581 RepID=A0A3R9Y9K1_9HYPH|nr:GyrI-like domain-containing protein [Aquibium carbonis]RST86275.1 hypothetical protein EJC49_11540 [Aquibium carbonis]